ncbi:hypothetical protein V502_00438 [Pseudogymnoascus sp. VKM F-4520 (FW-2644)]|nr:hypothetical protein V502_00438 [Pseudogymnoascus sp. VKM F-4520 (FW-2644)]
MTASPHLALFPWDRSQVETKASRIYHTSIMNYNMEDPLTISVNDAFYIVDPELPSFSYPDAYLDYQVPDIFNPSYLFGAQPNYSIEPYGHHNGAHSNPRTATAASALTTRSTSPNPTTTSPASSPAPLSLPRRPVLPESPRKSEEAAPAAQRQLKNGTEVAAAAAAAAAAVAPATSKEGSTGMQGSETKVKKLRKPRRNREAAYKCRVKKTKTEKDVKKVKTIGDDKAAKRIEVEGLRSEIEGLRVLLLPHYRGCGDERVVAYLDGVGGLGGGCGVTGVCVGFGRVDGEGERSEGREEQFDGAEMDEAEEERTDSRAEQNYHFGVH